MSDVLRCACVRLLCVCLYCSSLLACLPACFPSRFCFILLLKERPFFPDPDLVFSTVFAYRAVTPIGFNIPPIESITYPVADLGVGPEGHRPQLKSDWPLKCPCPVTHRGFTLALSRLKFNLCSASFTCKYEGTCV